MDILGIPIPVFVVLAIGAFIVFKFNLLSLLTKGGENRQRAEMESSWMPATSEEGATVMASNLSQGNAIILEDLGLRQNANTSIGVAVGPFRLRRVIMNSFGTTVTTSTENFSAANEAAAREMHREWCEKYMRPSQLIDGSRYYYDVYNPEKVFYINDNS